MKGGVGETKRMAVGGFSGDWVGLAGEKRC